MRLYCQTCGFQCHLGKHTREQYPGQYATAILSDCCTAPVVDELDKPLHYGELMQEYELQKSWEVIDHE